MYFINPVVKPHMTHMNRKKDVEHMDRTNNRKGHLKIRKKHILKCPFKLKFQMRAVFIMWVLFLISLTFSPNLSLGQEARFYDIVISPNIFKFDPEKITISVGDTVRWHNNDERNHVLASVPGSGQTDELEIFSDEFHPGTIYTHTFKVPGEYPYFCFIHNRMTGVITVIGKEK